MKAMRHRPAWSICRVCAMARRSTTDFRRGRYSDLSPGSHRTLVGWANHLVSAREGRPGNGSVCPGRCCGSCWLTQPIHARASEPHCAWCAGSTGFYRNFLGCAPQRATEAPRRVTQEGTDWCPLRPGPALACCLSTPSVPSALLAGELPLVRSEMDTL